jgi:[acyl-carrier-protein] S-malonyltransferase
MNEAAEATHGAMAAVLGLDDERVIEACLQVRAAGVVVPAVFNGPGQVVISGDFAGVEAAVEACRAAGAKRALLLPVQGANHSPLMESAERKMSAALAEGELRDPEIEFVSTVTGDLIRSGEKIRQTLASQIVRPVRWTETAERLLEMEIDLFIEIGPGRTLAGILKRMAPGVTCLSCSTPEDIEKVVKACETESVESTV